MSETLGPGIKLTDEAAHDTPVQRYEILGYNEIPIGYVDANPHNPRPSFHLSDDDANLASLGDSIRTTGQHRPALVFEKVGHYELPDRPGEFRLLQGERRWRACRLSSVDRLRCLIVRTPKSLAEELEWLGIEEAFKEEWQQFFLLAFAHRLAINLDVPITSNEIISRTGLTRDQLVVASKLFKLEPPIQDLVREYEEISYQVRQGKARGYKRGEFGANKAAVVYDICLALREAIPQICRPMTDLELQLVVVGKVTKDKSTLEHLNNMLASIKGDDNPGKQTLLAEFLGNPNVKITNVLRATDHAQVSKYRKLIARFGGFEAAVRALLPHLGQIGNDPDLLRADMLAVMRVQRALLELERGIDDQIKKHERS